MEKRGKIKKKFTSLLLCTMENITKSHLYINHLSFTLFQNCHSKIKLNLIVIDRGAIFFFKKQKGTILWQGLLPLVFFFWPLVTVGSHFFEAKINFHKQLKQ